jgi:hypothetical protein
MQIEFPGFFDHQINGFIDISGYQSEPVADYKPSV